MNFQHNPLLQLEMAMAIKQIQTDHSKMLKIIENATNVCTRIDNTLINISFMCAIIIITLTVCYCILAEIYSKYKCKLLILQDRRA